MGARSSKVINKIGGLDVVANKTDSYLGTPITGELTYDNGFSVEGDTLDGKGWRTPGEAAKKGAEYGLPQFIYGLPLGCGCSTAWLHAIGEVKNGLLEADYMCDSGWHNFVVLRVKENKKKKERKLQIDRSGNLVEEQEVKITELEEY